MKNNNVNVNLNEKVLLTTTLSHPYHLVTPSPWPILLSFSLLFAALGLISWFSHTLTHSFLSYLTILILLSFFWWRDVIRESYSGFHTTVVQRGIFIGFLLFLLSEIMIFITFFWAFFHSSLAPSVEIFGIWPPIGINPVNPWNLPLLGTSVLLSSGFVLTLSHHYFLSSFKSPSLFYLFFSIILGSFFVFLQYNEYFFAEFTLADSVFGSIFYLTTGLHAIHVILGLIFLLIGFIRLYFDHYSFTHCLGLEFAIIYWHLVDLIWLFVFVFYYWWGS